MISITPRNNIKKISSVLLAREYSFFSNVNLILFEQPFFFFHQVRWLLTLNTLEKVSNYLILAIGWLGYSQGWVLIGDDRRGLVVGFSISDLYFDNSISWGLISDSMTITWHSSLFTIHNLLILWYLYVNSH